MSYSSQPLPLEVWTRLHVRMAADYQVQLGRLAEALKPMPVTVDTGELALKRSAHERAAVFDLVHELENMQMLFMILGGQVRIATHRAEIPDVEAHIACLRNMATLFETSLCSLPRRTPLEQEVQSALAQYAALRTAGTGEVILSERQRLRSLIIQLPVVGAEDTGNHERALRSLHSQIDQKEAELQHLKVNTMLSLRVPDELARLVESFGVQMHQDLAPAALPPADAAALLAPEA